MANGTLGVVPKKLTDSQAQAVVFKVIKTSFPNAVLARDQALKLYGYIDRPTLIGLRDDIFSSCKVFIPDEIIVGCTTIEDVIGKLT